jgi:hypothetical protein
MFYSLVLPDLFHPLTYLEQGGGALVSRKFPYTVSELLQEALSMVQQTCERTQLSINPQKMVVVPFTRKRDLRGLKRTNQSLDINCKWLQKSNTSD